MSVRPNGLKYPCYWMYTDNRNEWRWVYYGDNGEEIAVSSEGYVAKKDCQNGINIMKRSSSSVVYEPANS
jgi:uncharacterized protein YegP (UPF0339 family)